MQPNLLIGMTNGLGGRTDIRYQPSTVFDNSGTDGVPDLPFPLWVATGVRRTDGLCDPPAGIDEFNRSQNTCIDQGHEIVGTTTYSGGLYSPENRELRGFARVIDTDVNGNDSVSTFEQGDYLFGRLKSREVYAGTYSTPVREIQNVWAAQDSVGGEGRKQVYLVENQVTERNLIQSGAEPSNDQCVMTRNAPPDIFGRVSHMCTLSCSAPGVPPMSTPAEACVSASDDGQAETISLWAAPQGFGHVFDRAYLVTTQDRFSSGATNILSQKEIYYDGTTGAPLPQGEVDRGSPTKTGSFVGPHHVGENQYGIEMRYDELGNLIYTYDLYREDLVFFDAFRLYPLSEWNSGTGYSRFLTFDLRNGRLVTLVDENGKTTRYKYDSLGRTECVALPGDSLFDCTREFFYQFGTGGVGVPLDTALTTTEVRTKEPNNSRGFVAEFGYVDALGRQVLQATEEVVGSDSAVSTVVKAHRTFDAAGSTAAVYPPYIRIGALPSSPPGSPTTYDYHLNGSTAVDPAARPHIVDPPDQTVQTTYFEGAKQRTVDARGNWRLIEFDARGRTIKKTSHASDDTILAMVESTYDGMDRVLTRMVDADPSTTVSHSYDYLGRVTDRIDPDSGHWKYGYDGRGNLVYVDDPKASQHTQSCFDAADRVTLSCNYLASDSFDGQACFTGCGGVGGSVEATYAYDSTEANGIGRLDAVTDTSGSVDYGYDDRGRLVSAARTTEGRTATFQYEFDSGRNLSRLTYPDGEVLTYAYNDAGRVVSAGGPDYTYLSSAEYDLFGRATKISHGNGVDETIGFHDASLGFRLKSITSTDSSVGVDHLDVEYGYNDLGKIDWILDRRDPTGDRSNSATYGYDGLGRLVQVTGTPSGQYDDQFDYDAVGNLTLTGGRSISYGGSAPHHITTSDSASFLYDDNGNLTYKGARVSNPAPLGIEYDVRNRVTTRHVDTTNTTMFKYDFAGERTLESPLNGDPIRHFGQLAYSEAGLLHKRYFAGNRLIAQRLVYAPEFSSVPAGGAPRPGWDLPAEFPAVLFLLSLVGLIGFGGSRRKSAGVRVVRSRALSATLLSIAMLVPSALLQPIEASAACEDDPAYTKHFHYDHLGSTQAISDSVGDLFHQVRYRAYGEIRGRFDGVGAPVVDSFDGRVEFTGYVADPSSGLQYAGARYYDPEIGQFLTHDPEQQFASPYAYGPGDPINGVDPDGAFFWIIGLIAVGLVVANAIYIGVKTGSFANFLGALFLGGLGILVSATIVGPLLASAVSTVNNPVFSAAVYGGLLGYGGYSTAQAARTGDILGAIGGAIALLSAAFGLAKSVRGGQSDRGISGGDGNTFSPQDGFNEGARLGNADVEIIRDWTQQREDIADIADDASIEIRDDFVGLEADGSRGYYDPNTDTILLNRSKIVGMADAAGVLVHENTHRLDRGTWRGFMSKVGDRFWGPTNPWHAQVYQIGDTAGAAYLSDARLGKVPIGYGGQYMSPRP